MIPEHGVIQNLIPMLETIKDTVPWGNNDEPDMPVGTRIYGILYKIPGGEDFGGMTNPNDSGSVHIQVTCVADSSIAGEWLQYRSRLVIVGRHTDGRFQVPFPDIDPGYAIIDRRLTEKGGCTTDGTSPAKWFSFTDRYSFTLSPR